MAAAASLFVPMATNLLQLLTVLGTLAVLFFTRVPPYGIIVGGLVLGLLL